ncbi:hypothetical protein SADUNF_Sadunf14G0120400 [Salix dunnii]|uniref:Ubiquitin-like domain-containing protein n=1 Tax=Salix dunnii TaxID=1413687 RepID=A0A835MQD0_9ROSI|nr:hypothetical protein SADUNF_Sadunf14G0120400 [Salix dunnii]
MSGVTGQPQEEDKKPNDQSAHINLKVKGQVLGFSSALRLFEAECFVWGFCYLFIYLFIVLDCLFVFRPFATAKLIWVYRLGNFVAEPFKMLNYKFQDGNEVFFRIKRSTQLKKLMNAYCDRQSVEFNSIAFLFDGRRLRGEQTPDELDMEDGDEIDAMLHQTGGAMKASN